MNTDSKRYVTTLTAFTLLAFGACTPDADGDGYDAVDDCDDNNAAIYPGAPELCDGIDNNCNLVVDEPSEAGNGYYLDADRDGYGDINAPVYGCDLPYGAVDNAEDCDDTKRSVHPGADELCDDTDNDCDGETDEAGAIGEAIWFLDGDNDGFGTTDSTTNACALPSGYSAIDGDCDDDNFEVNPGADEVCDDADNNCNAQIDENPTDGTRYYQDLDGDGYGDPDSSIVLCEIAEGLSESDSDCNDTSEFAYPGNPEICDGIDNDCDTSTLEIGLITDESGTNHSTIGEAISNAAEGGQVNICEGTYNVNLSISKSITLHGPAGASKTKLDGDGLDSVIVISPFSVNPIDFTLSGLTIRNGYATSFDGGGLFAFGADALTIRDVIFEDNGAYVGGALVAPRTPASPVVIDNTVFRNNYAGYGGAALLGYANVTDSWFSDNNAADGGAVYHLVGDLDLTGTTFVSNAASQNGGALISEKASLVNGGTFLANAAKSCGAVFLSEITEAKGMTMERNIAGFGGGALCAQRVGTLSNLTVKDNVSYERGGGIYLTEGVPSLTSVVLSGNSAVTGGAIYAEDSDVLITTSIVESNTDDTAAVAIDEDSYLESDNSDWGTGTTDNAPTDVGFPSGNSTGYTYGASASFECDGSNETCL